jgi:hypothetical protein
MLDVPSPRLAISYLLPVRMADAGDRDELTAYLRLVASCCADVIVVDGSAEDLFEANHEAWGSMVRHIAPDPAQRCLSGKVAGVHTGVSRAVHEHVVIADDDVRYDRAGLVRMSALLDRYDLVWPQNVFDELPWHARWDTARSLLNRAFGADFPGTLGIRRSRFIAMKGYDGDVLFENLELMRTVEAHGGRSVAPLDFLVDRRPPTVSHFWGQRVRQAYDDFAVPRRMVCWLSLVPLIALVLARARRPGRVLAATSVVATALAERGRRRGGVRGAFPISSSLLAPVWVLERGVCAWLAVVQRVRYGGVRYGDTVVVRAAHSRRDLRRRLRADQRCSLVAERSR